VYVEKFDISNSKVKLKLTSKEYLSIRTELINAFMCESQDTQVLLVNECEKRVFNSERGVVIFFTKSKFAQNFTTKVINEKLSSQGITARGPRSEPRPNLHVEFPAVLTRVQAKPVDIIKEAILMNAKIDCNPVLIVDRPNPKSLGRTISCLLPVEMLGQLQTWARRNNAKKLALFTESLRFWTVKKIDPTVHMPEVDSDQQVAASIITTTPVAVPITMSEEPSKSNEEEFAEVTDAPEGAQIDFATTETEVLDSTLVVVPISIQNESTKNNPQEIDEITDSVEATDTPEGVQGAVAVKAEATKVAKAKPAGKKGAHQSSPGSSIAKNRPKRACTLQRTICGQPIVEAPRKFSQSCIAKNRPRRTCTLKSKPIVWPVTHLVLTMNQMLTGPGKK
jgi:hypothetical protein